MSKSTKSTKRSNKSTKAVTVAKVGRPPTFTEVNRRRVANLAAKLGARPAQVQLRNSGSPLYARISLPTILRICREEGVSLKRGRRPLAA